MRQWMVRWRRERRLASFEPSVTASDAVLGVGGPRGRDLSRFFELMKRKEAREVLRATPPAIAGVLALHPQRSFSAHVVIFLPRPKQLERRARRKHIDIGVSPANNLICISIGRPL